jgi:polysaccharide export outer membrane protein
MGSIKFILLAMVFSLAAGCGTVPAARSPGPARAGTSVEPQGAGHSESAPEQEAAADTVRYRIRVGDALRIEVRGESDLSGDFKVTSDGAVVLPLLGRLAVAGLTASEAERDLTAALAKDYLVDPKVHVQVTSSVLRRVIVFGEVKSPGIYEMPVGERFSLLQVIAKAGGLTDLAALDRVRIVRRSGTAEKVVKVNVSELLRGGAGDDVVLQPNDLIIVPQTVF